MLSYTADELLEFRCYDVTLPRKTRKAIFGHRLWLPRSDRVCRQRCQQSNGLPPHQSVHAGGLQLGCVNASSVANKAAIFCQSIADEHLDLLMISETWHECSESVVLKTVTPPGWQCIDATRPVSADTDTFQNHGGLAIVYCAGLKMIKKTFQPTTTFEYLCGLAAVGNNRFLILGVYRPGSQAVSSVFFDEFADVFGTNQCLQMFHCYLWRF